MGKFFGTNGIRGIFGEDLTLEFVHDMTLAIGTYFAKGPILIGYDGRKSSPIICKIISSTLNSIGIDCNVAGMVPTPCLEYVVKTGKYSGGIMITASHNPPQYNGIKPVASDGVEISREDEAEIEKIYLQQNWMGKPQRWGTSSTEDHAIKTYLNGVASNIDSTSIESKGFRVVLDLGNGAQAVSAPHLARMLNCEIFLVNKDVDGDFPGRGSEPTPQNLSDLSSAVLKNNAHLGIAFDGDGDRSIFCDNDGNVLTGDRSALLLTRHILKKNPGASIVTCLNSGSGIEALVAESDSKVIRTKVGSVEVSRRMVQIGALIGYEENGGFMFGRHNQVRDGCMALALMLELLADCEGSLSDEVQSLPPSFTTKDKVSCPAGIVPRLVSSLKEEFPDADTTDGIKISINLRNWVMIRPSGTEPIVRVYAEAESQARLDGLMSEYIEKVKSVIANNTFNTKLKDEENGE